MNIKLFADTADLAMIEKLRANPTVKGFTTNPTLMRRAGVTDYRAFARDVLRIVPDLPVSFEVLSDDFDEMERQAHEIASWGDNVYVKIPITNTAGEFSLDAIWHLDLAGIKVNVTAITTLNQAFCATSRMSGRVHHLLSVFAGRIADAGIDPLPSVQMMARLQEVVPNIGLVWASSREVLNVFQAEQAGCYAITATPDIIAKIFVGLDLTLVSLMTVRQFYDDACRAGYKL